MIETAARLRRSVSEPADAATEDDDSESSEDVAAADETADDKDGGVEEGIELGGEDADDDDAELSEDEEEENVEEEAGEKGCDGLSAEALALLDGLLEDEQSDDGRDGQMASPELDGGDEDSDEVANIASGDGAANETSAASAGIVESLEDTVAKIIEEADLFAEACQDEPSTADEEGDAEGGESERDSKRRKLRQTFITRVLGDLFHIMDRVKVPMHHDFKAAYFAALRSAFFIMDAGDVERVKKVIEESGRSWSKTMVFNFRYIAQRVRRTVPIPSVLHRRVRAVIDFFQNQKDTKTGACLFNEKARKKADLVLKAILRGEYSDPPNQDCSLYCRKTDAYGREMTDENGLPLYRSLRGTSLLESLHQKLTKAFGHTMAGVMYSDCLLALLRHQTNWRASERNRPDFPQVRHYEGLLIDAVNELYESVFGERKYANWDSSDKYMVELSPFGIVPLDKEGPDSRHVDPVEGLTKSLHYLSVRQRSNIPFTPVETAEEKRLFNQLVSQLLQVSFYRHFLLF